MEYKYQKGIRLSKEEFKDMSIPERKQFLLDALSENYGIVKTATDALGCDRTTFYNYYNNDKDFKEKVDNIREETLDLVEKKHHELIDEGNAAMIQFHLRTKGKHRGYQESVLNTNINKDITIGFDQESKDENEDDILE